MTKIVAAQDLELVGDLCQRTVILDRGEIVADSSSEAILNDGSLLRAHGLLLVEKSFLIQTDV